MLHSPNRACRVKEGSRCNRVLAGFDHVRILRIFLAEGIHIPRK